MLRFLPWRFLVKSAARRYGVLDPATFLARMRKFAQPSEVSEPLELLRAGIIFHARGLVNAKAIQHNLDWVWPYWVERQFNPDDSSFIPRAFSFSHINLTHRNWTAVGLPDLASYPITDPRGLTTPLHDGWSLDFWIVTDQKRKLLPSKVDGAHCQQVLHLEPNLMVETTTTADDLSLNLRSSMTRGTNAVTALSIDIEAKADEVGWLVVAIRPYNPEGVQFIDHLEHTPGSAQVKVNGSTIVNFSEVPQGMRMAHYADGDVYHALGEPQHQTEIRCDVGMATAAALFRIQACEARRLSVHVPLDVRTPSPGTPRCSPDTQAWSEAMKDRARLKVPDEKIQFLYDAAVKTVLLLSAEAFVPGPYTYRRFWFRDACLMLNSLLCIGATDRAERIIATFPGRQTMAGYFESQEGEWDSNGQVLWIVARFSQIVGRPLSKEMEAAVRKGVRWLQKKRLPDTQADGTAGLLPAGFSAEHLGPNDFYYWDDYWALGGLRAIHDYWQEAGDPAAAREAAELADQFSASIEKSIAATRGKGAIPAAPSRRMDAGAIGSLVADYPLQLYPPGESRILKTVEFLTSHCYHKGGFFQEMIHSGINAYLTLDIAQTLLRAGDRGYETMIRTVAGLASPTGQWPEAIHPSTMGGCMGDGQHGWAAAEWIMMIRNCFVREEGNEVIIGSGILPEWLDAEEVRYGPTLTAWGEVEVTISHGEVLVQARWRKHLPHLSIAIPGFETIPNASPGRRYPLLPTPV